VSIADIDASARRVLGLKQKLGLLDDPYRRVSVSAVPRFDTENLALEAARRAIVLLTNDGILPLSQKAKRIAVIGPLAETRSEMLGPWTAAGDPEKGVTILDGLRALLRDCDIMHGSGGGIDRADSGAIHAACALCEQAELIILRVGEASWMSGEAASRASLDLPGRQRELAERVFSIGKPVVAILCSGRPLTAPWLVERAQRAPEITPCSSRRSPR
jgi:beta-glucosidase